MSSKAVRGSVHDKKARSLLSGLLVLYGLGVVVGSSGGAVDAGVRDAESALGTAREIGQAGTLMFGLGNSAIVQILCGNHSIARARAQEQAALAKEKGAPFWTAFGLMNHGCALMLVSQPDRAIELLAAGIAMVRATGSRMWLPFYLANLARAYAELGRFEDASGRIAEALTAVETTRENWWEAEVHRAAGEVELMSSAPDTAKAIEHFERALEIARTRQARSWELRAAMSMARLRRDQGKRQHARDLLTSVYAWFTEGFERATY